MKSKEELNREAQSFLEQYKQKEVYGTSDGQFFLDKNRAELHARSKKELSVYVFPKDGSTTAEANEDWAEKLKATEDVNTLIYPELKNMVKGLGLEVENQKQATLIEALEKHKETLNN
ncbi:hypothetical protein ETU08_01780 [Apibacter muscae]|uniref:hypothetical protein n=1 Tax=Apibacter muscae TaxID=2509004 RepID=UPI0011AD22E5|nr:hypothetical protein [Apibacter muscae]TWP31235.1 hypothetical protein ETU08_01780 [Apibacter muscae]